MEGFRNLDHQKPKSGCKAEGKKSPCTVKYCRELKENEGFQKRTTKVAIKSVLVIRSKAGLESWEAVGNMAEDAFI